MMTTHAEAAALADVHLSLPDPEAAAQTLATTKSLTQPDLANEYNPIPTEHDRPRFVVLDELYTAADGSKYRAGVWHFGIKPSKGDNPPTLVQQWVCSPLHVDAVTHDSTGANFGRLLRFRNTLGKWGLWAMPMEMLRGDAADLRGVLLGLGCTLTPAMRAVTCWPPTCKARHHHARWKPCYKPAGRVVSSKPMPCRIPSLAPCRACDVSE